MHLFNYCESSGLIILYDLMAGNMFMEKSSQRAKVCYRKANNYEPEINDIG